MKAKEPVGAYGGNMIVPHLRSFIVDKIEEESDVSVLEQVYALLYPSDQSFRTKYLQAKEQTEKYCVPELARDLETEGYMINKPYPYEDSRIDFDRLVEEDANDGDAPQEWLEKMFPELYA